MSRYFSHSGIKGQKWGVRRYQYEDGSYTPEGKIRYGRTEYSVSKDSHGNDVYESTNRSTRTYTTKVKNKDGSVSYYREGKDEHDLRIRAEKFLNKASKKGWNKKILETGKKAFTSMPDDKITVPSGSTRSESDIFREFDEREKNQEEARRRELAYAAIAYEYGRNQKPQTDPYSDAYINAYAKVVRKKEKE